MRIVPPERVCLGNETEGIGDGVVAFVLGLFRGGDPGALDGCWVGE